MKQTIIIITLLILLVLLTGQEGCIKGELELCLEKIGKDYCISKNEIFKDVTYDIYNGHRFSCLNEDRQKIYYYFSEEEITGCKQ